MTIIVGVLCNDGVVIGADSATTFAAGQIRTIEQPSKKVRLLCGNEVILAGTGEVGMGQRFAEIIEDVHKQGAFSKPENTPIKLGCGLAQLAIQNFQVTAANLAGYGALLAFCSNGNPHLCEFAIGTFQPELKTNDIWYVSMGSGQLIVDPFLALIRKVFWDDGMPNCQDAAFAVYWAIQHAIDVNPGGVNGPVSIGVLKHIDNKFTATVLTQEQLAAHAENVNAAERHLRQYKNVLHGESAAGAPSLPKAPK